MSKYCVSICLQIYRRYTGKNTIALRGLLELGLKTARLQSEPHQKEHGSYD